MKHPIYAGLALCCLFSILSLPAAALEYTVSGPEQSLFGQPTSDDTIYVDADEPANMDRSKNAAIIPPAFGSPIAYTLNSGEPLTPNLTGQGTAPIAADTGIYTATASGLYGTGELLGMLEIPALTLYVNVYQGTDSAALANGVGHFESTGLWDGNVAIAGHNRGVNSYFGEIHTLKPGDTIRWRTWQGAREYTVQSVGKIAAGNVSVLDASAQNILTLITCVKNQLDYRWCVRAASLTD